MARKKTITQKKAAFYLLWKAYRENPEQYVPVWKFVGEIYIEELNIWYLMSYKTPTNGLDIFKDNPGLFERRWVKGRSGAKYYEYRFAPNPTSEKIVEPEIKEFYNDLKNGLRVLNIKKQRSNDIQE